MDIMIILQVIVLLGAIFIGIRLGGIAIGYAGGLGVVILGLVLGMKPGNIPWDVILIIAAAIAAISAMQQAGGLDYMVRVTEKILRSSPKYKLFSSSLWVVAYNLSRNRKCSIFFNACCS